MLSIDYFKFQRSENRYYALDALRTLAVLLVVFRHGILPFPLHEIMKKGEGTPLIAVMNFVASIGWTGVDLFFVLSGFLIGSQLLNFFEAKQPLKNIWRFYANRMFRIFPAYYAILLLIQFVLIRWPSLFDVVYFQNIPKMIGNHYFFLQDYTGPYLYPALWSLAVEEKFYIVAPLFLMALYWFRHRKPEKPEGEKPGKVPLVFFTFLMSIPILGRLVYFFLSPEKTDIFYLHFRFSQLHARCDGLIAGMIIAYLVKYCADQGWMKHPRTPYVLLGGGSIAMLLILLSAPNDLNRHFLLSDILFSGTLISLGYGAMVLGGVLLGNEKAGFLGNRLFYYIATVSYSLYLTHSLVFQSVMTTWLPLTNGWQWSLDGQLASYLAIYLITATTVATVFYWLIEKPFLLLKEKMGFMKA